MKKNLTELVFILDRSGSMGGLEQDTIGGFNAMLILSLIHISFCRAAAPAVPSIRRQGSRS